MNLQDLSQTLTGPLCVQELVPEARSFLDDAGGREDEFVRQAIMRTPKLIPKERNRDVVVLTLPVILWACVRLELHSVPEVPQLLGSVAESLGSRKQVSRLNAWGLCVLHESYKVLDPSEQFSKFTDKLTAEISRRRLSASDVERSFEGPLQWRRDRR